MSQIRTVEATTALQLQYSEQLRDLLIAALKDGVELSITGSESPRQDLPAEWSTRKVCMPLPLSIVDHHLLQPLAVVSTVFIMKSDADTVIGQYIPDQWDTGTPEAMKEMDNRQTTLNALNGIPPDMAISAPNEIPAELVEVTMPNGLKYTDLVVGTGQEAAPGFMVSCHYTGWLQNPDGTKGAKFDSSVDRNDPFELALGNGLVIQGWDLGIVGMRQGGKRLLVIPPELGYGNRGAGNVIPAGATLIFEIEVLRFY
jgi:FKBP-type peptidyl-prolyl cis-trans isomerase FkpA